MCRWIGVPYRLTENMFSLIVVSSDYLTRLVLLKLQDTSHALGGLGLGGSRWTLLHVAAFSAANGGRS